MEAINASNVSSLIAGVTSCFAMVRVKWVSGEYHRGLTTHLLCVFVRCGAFKRIKERDLVDL